MCFVDDANLSRYKSYMDIIITLDLTPKCDKDGGGVDHTHITIEGGQVESLSSEVNRGDGERGTVGDGDS